MLGFQAASADWINEGRSGDTPQLADQKAHGMGGMLDMQDALGTIPNGAGPLGNGSRPSLDSTISPRHPRRSLEASTDALSIIDLMLQGE